VTVSLGAQTINIHTYLLTYLLTPQLFVQFTPHTQTSVNCYFSGESAGTALE